MRESRRQITDMINNAERMLREIKDSDNIGIISHVTGLDEKIGRKIVVTILSCAMVATPATALPQTSTRFSQHTARP